MRARIIGDGSPIIRPGFPSGGGRLPGDLVWAKALPDPSYALVDGNPVDVLSPGAFPYALNPGLFFGNEITVDATLKTPLAYSPGYDVSVTGIVYGLGLYVICGTGCRLWWATDLAGPWTACTFDNGADTTQDFYAIAFGSGQFMAVGSNGMWARSTNGKTFLRSVVNSGAPNQGAGHIPDVAWSPAQGFFVVVSIPPSPMTGNGIVNLWRIAPASGDWSRVTNFGSATCSLNTRCLGVSPTGGVYFAYATTYNSSGQAMFYSVNTSVYTVYDPGTNGYLSPPKAFTFSSGRVLIQTTGLYDYGGNIFNGGTSRETAIATQNRSAGQFAAEVDGFSVVDRTITNNGGDFVWNIAEGDVVNFRNASSVDQAVPAEAFVRRGCAYLVNGKTVFLTAKGYRLGRISRNSFTPKSIANFKDKSGATLYPYLKVA